MFKKAAYKSKPEPVGISFKQTVSFQAEEEDDFGKFISFLP